MPEINKYVFTRVANSYANLLEPKKEFTKERSLKTPTGLFWDTNMAPILLFWDTNMADVTSCLSSSIMYFIGCPVHIPITSCPKKRLLFSTDLQSNRQNREDLKYLRNFY